VLTVEACIAFVAFAMIMFTILFLIRIVYTYGIIQHSVTQTAKELASYSYLYSLSGLKDVDDSISSNTAAGRKNFETRTSEIIGGYEAIVNGKESANTAYDSVKNNDIEGVVNGVNGISGAYGDLKDSNAIGAVKDIVSDPMKAAKSLGGVLAYSAKEEVKTFLLGEISRAMASGYIDPSGNADDKLLKLRVIDGLSGLDFSASKFFADGGDEIDIIVCYTIDPIMPIDILPDMNLSNRACVRAWGMERAKPREVASGEEGESVWTAPPMERGKIIHKEFESRVKNDGTNSADVISVDLSSKTYQDADKLESMLKGKIDTMLNPAAKNRELVVVIPSDDAASYDEAILNAALAKLKERPGYENVKITPVKYDSRIAEPS
jgi:hypothetical protein